jgi:hypothetical protein
VKSKESGQGAGPGLVKSRSPIPGPKCRPPYFTPALTLDSSPFPPHPDLTPHPHDLSRPCTPCPANHIPKTAPLPPPQGGRTPLHTAAAEGHTEAVTALIEAKADLEAKDKVRGEEGRGVARGDRSGGRVMIGVTTLLRPPPYGSRPFLK